jgi:hypothetical protein
MDAQEKGSDWSIQGALEDIETELSEMKEDLAICYSLVNKMAFRCSFWRVWATVLAFTLLAQCVVFPIIWAILR